MTKAQLVELVKIRLGDTDKYGERTIAKYIAMAFDQIVYTTFRADQSNLDLYRKMYENVPIVRNTTNRLRYSMLPESIVQLPELSNGVRILRYCRNVDSGIDFVPTSDDYREIYNELDVAEVDTSTGYIVREDKVEYDDNLPEDIPHVTMYLVIPFDKYNDADEVHIPSGMDLKMFEVVLALISGTPPVKETNDNNPNTI